jgi:hypothetical protein
MEQDVFQFQVPVKHNWVGTVEVSQALCYLLAPLQSVMVAEYRVQQVGLQGNTGLRPCKLFNWNLV